MSCPISRALIRKAFAYTYIRRVWLAYHMRKVLTQAIGQTHPWTEIQDAHREMEENKTSGKIIVEITE